MGKSAAANWAGRWARGGKPDPLLPSTIAEKNKAKSDSYFSMPMNQRMSLHKMGNAPKYSDPNPPKAGESFSPSNKHYISQQQFAAKPQKIDRNYNG